MSDAIATVDHYRGVPIHDGQPQSRIERIVKPQIDKIYQIDDVAELFAFASSVLNCPEGRLFAASKIEAIWENKAFNREARPQGITLELLRARVTGLNSIRWRDDKYYCSKLDYPAYGRPGSPRPARREKELPE